MCGVFDIDEQVNLVARSGRCIIDIFVTAEEALQLIADEGYDRHTVIPAHAAKDEHADARRYVTEV